MQIWIFQESAAAPVQKMRTVKMSASQTQEIQHQLWEAQRDRLNSRRSQVRSARTTTVVQPFRVSQLRPNTSKIVSHNRNDILASDRVKKQKEIERRTADIEYRKKLGEDVGQLQEELNQLLGIKKKKPGKPQTDKFASYVPYDRLKYDIPNTPSANYYNYSVAPGVAKQISLQPQDPYYVKVKQGRTDSPERPRTCKAQVAALERSLEERSPIRKDATRHLLEYRQRQWATQTRLQARQAEQIEYKRAAAIEAKGKIDDPFITHNAVEAFQAKSRHGASKPTIMIADRWKARNNLDNEQIAPNSYKPNYNFGTPKHIHDVRINVHSRGSYLNLKGNDVFYDYTLPSKVPYAGLWNQSKQCERNKDMEYQEFLEQIGEI